MHPVLFQIGSVTVHSYGVLVAAGVLLGLWLARRQAAAAHSSGAGPAGASGAGLDPDRVWNLGIYMVLAALVGAKLWYVASYWSYYRANPREIFTLSTLQSAGVFYGGLVTAIVVAVLYARHAKLRFLPLADVYAAPLALGHAVGRLGCFFAGCCWGKPTSVAWAVAFTDSYAAQVVGVPLGVPLHPTQLYEAAAEFVNFGILIWLGRGPRAVGQLFAAYAMLYGVTRGLTEFFRGDPGRTMLFGGAVSLMQLVSVALIGLGAWLWWRAQPGRQGSKEAKR